MTKIPNNVIKPPPGFEYVQQGSVPIMQPNQSKMIQKRKNRIS